MVIFSSVRESYPNATGALGTLNKNLIVFCGMRLSDNIYRSHFRNSRFIKEPALAASGAADSTPLGVGFFKLLDQQHRIPSFWQLLHFLQQRWVQSQNHSHILPGTSRKAPGLPRLDPGAGWCTSWF